MIKIYSPRIHNLGDFMHCLPALSGLHKTLKYKFSFVICDRLERFVGIKELLMQQEMFGEVKFMHEETTVSQRYILLDDIGEEKEHGNSPIACHRFYNFIRDNYKINFDIDDDFELNVPNLNIDYHTDKLIIGDRWSPKDAPDVDERRYSNLIESSEIVPKEKAHYLDYKKDLIYNCSLIKNNPNPFITTFTGIGIVADLMKKDCYILWDEDLRNWQGWGVEHDYKLHYYQNRNSKLVYIRDFKL
jgi:hypothetical protein